MKKQRQFVLFLGDIILISISFIATIYLGFWNNVTKKLISDHILPFAILYIFWFSIMYVFGLYDLKIVRQKTEILSKTIKATIGCLLIGLSFFYLIPLFSITPKTNLLINVLVFGFLIFLWRKLFFFLFSLVYLQNVAFLGKTKLSENLQKQIETQPQLGYRFVKFLDKKKNIKKQLIDGKIKVLIIAEDISENEAIVKELYQCLSCITTFIDLAKAYELILNKLPVDFTDKLWFLNNMTNNEKKLYDNTKRILDIFLSSILLCITFPIWLITSFLIKIEDKGPIFYRQQRVGKNSKTFQIWKFRSMVENAEQNGAKWAEKEDKRRTKTGKVIRRFHIDEFPQLINVLKGDLSLTGPRPERPEFVKHLEKEIPHYDLRHIIKPGFTGWAQTRWIKYARNKEESHEKFQYDLYYIKNRSIILDLGILLRTFQLFFKKG